MQLIQSEEIVVLVCIKGICVFQTETTANKILMKWAERCFKRTIFHVSYTYTDLVLADIANFLNMIMLIIIAYICLYLKFKILADTSAELGFFLILASLIYSYVNILLGLKIQHDLQHTNLRLGCPNGITTTSVAPVCLHIL